MQQIKIGQFTLSGNARTVVVYRNLYGRELLSDLVKYNQNTIDTFQKMKELNAVQEFEEFTQEQFEQLSVEQKVAYTQTVEKLLQDASNNHGAYYDMSIITTERQNFLMDAFVACVISANYKNPQSKDDIIDNIDLSWFCQGREFEQLQSFLNSIYPSGKTTKIGGETSTEPSGSVHTTTAQTIV
ncbi:MAG: hypothetical protein FWF56_03510 [Firmicutes bacterium]|nr:hypothetical protein [Bacillota bacterium]